MQIPRESIAIQQVVGRLADILGTPASPVDTGNRARTSARPGNAVLRARGHRFVVEWKRSGSVSVVAGAIQQLRMARSSFSHEVVPLLAVPHMGEAAQDLCARADLAWLDLSGNARIVVPGIFYQNLGHPNQYRRPGRPESAFGPKGSRIARRLLLEPFRTVRQREIATRAGLSEGHVSRVVRKLVGAGLIERDEDGIFVADRERLLDAWREDYRFDRHHVIRGHIAAGSGESLTRSIAEGLDRCGAAYAATALAAAWLWTRYAGFRLSTVYLSSPPSPALKSDIGFREVTRGANTWLVVPNDEGVFDGAESVDGIRCVHPVQAYLDMKDHPERAPEAAAELRGRLFPAEQR